MIQGFIPGGLVLLSIQPSPDTTLSPSTTWLHRARQNSTKCYLLWVPLLLSVMGCSLLVRQPSHTSLYVYVAQTAPINRADVTQNRIFLDIRATAAVYNGHLSKMRDQIHDLTAEHTMVFAQKDAAIVELKREVDEPRTQNTELSCGFHEEINNRKLAVVCAENLTRQNDIQGKKVMTLTSRVTELEKELAQEKAKHIADKGANEKLRSITEKCAEIARLVGEYP